MARIGMDPAVVAGLQRAMVGMAGVSHIVDDAGATLEELVSAVITHALYDHCSEWSIDVTDRRTIIMKALRTIGFDYSADAIRDYVPPATPKTAGPDIG